LALAKPQKQSRKISLQLSGHSLLEKTSSANVRIIGGKTSSTSVGRVGAGRALSRALDLFDLGSFASDGEAVAPMPRQKYPRNLLLRRLSQNLPTPLL
jgi:hypothetical protein